MVVVIPSRVGIPNCPEYRVRVVVATKFDDSEVVVEPYRRVHLMEVVAVGKKTKHHS